MPDISKLQIHPARPQDFDMLAEMYKSHREYHQRLGYPERESLEKRLRQFRYYIGDPQWLALVAECEGAAGGYALARLWKGEKFHGRGYLVDIFITRDHRSCGTGSALLEAVEERLREKGARGFVTEVAARNVSALSFFRKKGYAWAMHCEDALGAYQDAIDDREMTTGELGKYLRHVPEGHLPDRFWLLKGGAVEGLHRPYIKITVVDGVCSYGHKSGDEWQAGKRTPGGICAAAYHSMYPYIDALLHGANYEWAETDGSLLVRCPYGKRNKGVIFRLKLAE